MAESGLYTVGGTVQAQEGGIYVERQADAELLRLCQQGSFAYVLTPRQLGKSSLMIRTAERLIEAEIRPVVIDLTQIGTQLAADAWYGDFLDLVASQLDLSTNVRQWWQSHNQSGNTLRLTRFCEEVLLREVAEPIVIFVDEIDTTLSLNFTDDFFAAIRYLYVARSTNPELRRLSFVLIGVATPADLIQDPKRTPFNIGERVELHDFTPSEARPLVAGLGLSQASTDQALAWILGWTGGHPYLSQRLCSELLKASPQSLSKTSVNAMVRQCFLGDRSELDNNLQFVGDMLTKRCPHPYEQQLLSTYRAIRRGRPAVADEEQNLVLSHLKLAGIVRCEGRNLRVRNRIYAEVFNAAWINNHDPEDFWKRYGPVLKWAMPLSAASILVAVAMTGLALEATNQKQLAEQQTAIAEQQKKEANKAKSEAQYALRKEQQALRKERDANKARLKALDSAEEQRRLAETQALLAGQAKQRAESQSAIAQLREQAARVLNLLPLQTPLSGMLLAIDVFDRSRSVPEVQVEGFSSLLQALETSLEANRLQGHTDGVRSVAFSPDGRRIVSGSWDNSLRLWDASSGKQLGPPLQGHTGAVISVAFSPDGRRIVSGSRDNSLRLWDASSGKPLGPPLQGHTAEVNSVAFSPDGRRIVSGSADNSLRLWDASSGKQLGPPLQGHNSSVSSVAFSPDGRRIVSGSGDGTLRLWDAGSGKPLGPPLQGHTAEVNSVAFSPDGRRIVSGSEDNSLRLWDASSGKQLGTPLQGHTNGVSSVAFSPDGRRIVSGSLDKTLRLWDASSGKQLGPPLQGHTKWVWSVAFSPDGRRIVSGSSDNSLRLWRVSSPEGYLALACERLRYHPLLHSPAKAASELAAEDMEVAKRAGAVCRRTWARGPSWGAGLLRRLAQVIHS